MDARQTLTTFLDKAIEKPRRERVVRFAAKRKTQAKFLNLLYHQLGSYISPECRVEKLPSEVWKLPAFAFAPTTGFGATYPSMQAAYLELADSGSGCLVLSQNGEFGIWCDETYHDAQVFVRASRKRAV